MAHALRFRYTKLRHQDPIKETVTALCYPESFRITQLNISSSLETLGRFGIMMTPWGKEDMGQKEGLLQ